MKYYNLKNAILKHLFLLVIIMMFLVNCSIGANPGSPVLSNSSVAYISEENTSQVNDFSSAAHLLPCTGPGAIAAVSGSITCYEPVVTLAGSSPTSGVTYSWSGPDGFTSASQFSFVDKPGEYILTVTSNGCISKCSVAVLMNTTPPAVEASVSGVLNNNVTTVILSGTSSNPNVDYFWTGPNGFISTEAIAFTNMPGAYTLIVTDPLNGCSGTASVTVLEVIE